jgi:hypothetical protein
MNDRNNIVSIRLRNISGNVIWNKQFAATPGRNTVPLDHLQELPSGIYILELYNGTTYDKLKMSIHH